MVIFDSCSTVPTNNCCPHCSQPKNKCTCCSIFYINSYPEEKVVFIDNNPDKPNGRRKGQRSANKKIYFNK